VVLEVVDLEILQMQLRVQVVAAAEEELMELVVLVVLLVVVLLQVLEVLELHLKVVMVVLEQPLQIILNQVDQQVILEMLLLFPTMEPE
jgi:hypothetical protein